MVGQFGKLLQLQSAPEERQLMEYDSIVSFSNEVWHPMARGYAEGFRHVIVYVRGFEAWLAREYKPGAGEKVYYICEADVDLMQQFERDGILQGQQGQDAIARNGTAIPVKRQVRRYGPFVWYRKTPTGYAKHVLGIRGRHIRRPYHLFRYLSPTEQDPKKLKPVAAIGQHLAPVK